jgi:hypothetical protein
LKRTSTANSIRGTVLLPDGNPAAGVEVALCTAEAGVMLRGTSFEPGAFGNISRDEKGSYRAKTDDQGFFSLPPQPGSHTLAAVSPAGLGQVRCFDFSNPLEIRLQAWGRIEGTVRARDGQWGGRKVSWSHPGNLTSWRTLFYDSKGFSTVSEPDGKFCIENVPPGDCRMAVENGPGTGAVYSSSIQVKPGETVQVQVGGMGRQVTGKVIAPPGVEIRSWPNQVTAQLHIEWDDYHVPEGLTGNAVERWKLEFENTEVGRSWFRDQYAYYFKVNEDGSFSLPEVLPGKYRLFIHVGQGYLGSGSISKPSDPADPQIASAAPKVTVTDDASPLDLGDIKLYATH